MRALALVFVSISFLPACFDPPGGGLGGTTSLKSKPQPSIVSEVAVTAREDGAVTGRLLPNSQVSQRLSAPADGPLAGTSLILPPGALGVSTDVTIETGASLTEGGALPEKLGGANAATVVGAGAAIVIASSADVDAVVPFTVSLPLPEVGAGLVDAFYAVIFKVRVASEGIFKDGVLPMGKVRVVAGRLEFETVNFGSFQPIVTDKPIQDAVAVKSDAPIVTKAAVKGLPIVVETIDNLTPASKAVVTLGGKNFRSSMTLALADGSRVPVTMKSDVSASFVMPANAKYGFNTLTVEQDGVKDEVKLFARVEKTEFPLITIDPAGVCAGVTYYDAAGNVQKGTRECAAAAAAAPAAKSLDANNDGKADKAEVADHATTAGTASVSQRSDFALGTAGQPLASAATLSIPNDGSYFRVTGGSAISALASSVGPGRRVTLVFDSQTSIVNSPALRLRGGMGYVAGPGDVFEFVATETGWSELGRYSTNASEVHLRMDNVGVTLTPYVDTVLPFSEEVKDNQSEYDRGGTNRFIPKVNGVYKFDLGIYAEGFPMWSKSHVSIKILVNGATVNSLSYCHSDNNTMLDCPPITHSQALKVDDVVEFAFHYYRDSKKDAGAPNPAVLKSSNTFVKVKLIH